MCVTADTNIQYSTLNLPALPQDGHSEFFFLAGFIMGVLLLVLLGSNGRNVGKSPKVFTARLFLCTNINAIDSYFLILGSVEKNLIY